MRSFLERCFDALQSSGAGKRNAGGMWPVSALPYQPEADVDRSPAAGGVLNRLGGDQLRYTDVRQRILSIDGAGRWKLVEGGYTVIQPVVEGEGAAVFRRWRVRVKNLRPHLHAVIYGLEPVLLETCLQEGWPHGFTQVSLLSPERAAYAVGYTAKKMTRADDPRLKGKVPEFTLTSRNPSWVAGTERIAGMALDEGGLRVHFENLRRSEASSRLRKGLSDRADAYQQASRRSWFAGYGPAKG